MPAWTPADGGVLVAVKVQPKSGREMVGGRSALAEDRLSIRVTAVPEDGKATLAAAKALARALDVPSSAVTLVRGATSRQKTFHVAGDPPGLIARLENL
jgi:hypothetical protein